MRFTDEMEIVDVVRRFEDGSISRDEWKHAEHLTVALYYLTKDGLGPATEKMRTGIFKLLDAFGVDLTKEMPYHETLTVFWMNTIDQFNRNNEGASLLDKANRLVADHDKDYPLRFYSREYLFSDLARSEYVPGDLLGDDRQ